MDYSSEIAFSICLFKLTIFHRPASTRYRPASLESRSPFGPSPPCLLRTMCLKIAGEQTLSAPRERVWTLFNDPERLSRLIPGCEKLDVISPTEFAGTLNVGVAAVKGVY